MSNHASEGDLAELALAVYVEELLADRYVLYVGEPDRAVLERLARSAHRVEVVSPEARARGTRRGGRVSSRPWPTADDEGRWDVVIVPDLPAAGLAEEGEIERLARWLADGGVLVAGTPDPEGRARNASALAYEDFFERLEGTFESVRMLGQAPFTAWSVVDFAPQSDRLGVTFDGSLLAGSGEAAVRYFALCGDRDVVLDAYAVIQVPSSVALAPPTDSRASTGRVAELSERLREKQDALDAAHVLAKTLERDLEASHDDLQDARADLDRARTRAEDAERRAAALADAVARLEDALAEERDASKSRAEDEEYARLEAALHDRGEELTELRQELARRATLVRDLIEELEEERAARGRAASEPPPAAGSPSGGAEGGSTSSAPSEMSLRSPSHAETGPRTAPDPLTEVVERAVLAEAEKAELAFRLDELRGELAVAQRGSAQNLLEMQRVESALRGTVRGLNARLAEVTELYQLAQARFALVDEDRRALEAKNRVLMKELAELRDQLELELVRGLAEREAAARRESDGSTEAANERWRRSEERASQQERELLDALAQCREECAELASAERRAQVEADRARENLAALEGRVDGMRFGYEARLAELVAELDGVSADAERALVQVGELRSKLEVRERAEASLRGELAGTRLRLSDREEAVRALRAAASSAPAADGPVEEAAPSRRVVVAGRRAVDSVTDGTEADQAGDFPTDAAAELARAREEIEALREPMSRPNGMPPEVRRDLEQLRAALGARDALVGRLQAAGWQSVERRRELEQQLADCRRRFEEQREALSMATRASSAQIEEGRRELLQLTERLGQSEQERERALAALEEARGILKRLTQDLPAHGDEPYVPEDAGEARRLRERLSKLDAEAADREVLLRSLTAQLQERDDRIRALERLRERGEDGDEDRAALQARLLEMEERVLRLTEELDHERDARQRLENRA